MSVFQRKTSAGFTKEYHYNFIQKGKRYYGVCEGCFTKQAAEEYEQRLRKQAKTLSEQKTVKALVENFREELTGGEVITLAKAYDAYLKKPRRRQPDKRRAFLKQSYWQDFLAFMEQKYPDVKTISSVRRKHAEEYIQHLRENGRFNKLRSYARKGTVKTAYVQSATALANNTINDYHMLLTEVFDLLKHDAGIIENPFAVIPKLPKEAESRDAFSIDEVRRIFESEDHFAKPLFIIALMTALREGDICTLQWDEIDFSHDMISRRKMNKTGKAVQIPIMPHLKSFLLEQYQKTGTDEYVLPEHAEMYLSNPTGVTYRIKGYLEMLGIQTSRKVAGRSRNMSVKDLHSCRHTFCYLAGLAGIPLVVVQSIVGHMTPEMTKHYSSHATIQDKKEKMKLLSNFMGQAGRNELLPGSEPEREKLIELAKTLPVAKIKQLLRYIEK